MSDPTNPIITAISGDGPCKALDLSALPLAVLIPIVRIAMDVVDEWNNGNISTQCEHTEQSMDKLTSEVESLYAQLQPIIPGGTQITRMDLMSTDSYPIIRDGAVHRVKPADLIPLEMKALQDWLAFHGSIAKNAAENLKQYGHQLGADVR